MQLWYTLTLSICMHSLYECRVLNVDYVDVFMQNNNVKTKIYKYIYKTDINQRKTTSWHKSSQIFG